MLIITRVNIGAIQVQADLKMTGKSAVYYEIGKPALDLLGMAFSAMKWGK